MIASSDKILPFNTLAFPYSQTWSIDAAHTNLQRMDLNPFILTESNPQLSSAGHVTFKKKKEKERSQLSIVFLPKTHWIHHHNAI